MKHRMWIALPLAAALMAPAYCQQDSSSASPASSAAAQASVNTADQPLPPLQNERHEGFWGKLNPMARKKYVQRQLAPIRDRVNELDDLTAANGKMIKDVDARAQEGIRLASLRADQADQHAVDAGNRAQLADQTAQQANNRLQTVQTAVTNIDQYRPVTETEIRLRPGQAVLSRQAKEKLDQMADSVKGQNGYLFQVQGFASGTGTAAIQNSQRMAQSVVRYLVLSHEIPVYRIYLLGLGNAPHSGTSGNRVEVSLLKNPNLEQLSSAAPLQAAGAPAAGMAAQPAGSTAVGATAGSQAPDASAPSGSQMAPPTPQQ